MQRWKARFCSFRQMGGESKGVQTNSVGIDLVERLFPKTQSVKKV